ncbi:iron transporter [Halosimplex aquaticum]|uniref:Iron transporter n=1 Tax=Halosimplex aquaticum TaxID=3026162 RepID=A0ABD5Y717_9EURY|nr:iron transporter [Halosimplex aquaticum]
MYRRRFLAAGVAAASVGAAGCRSMFQTRSARAPPLVEDRPDAVYVPTHVEGMEMVGTADAGDYKVALTYSYPHRFWRAEGDQPTKVEIQGSDTVHLMTMVWDAETGTVVPNGSITTTITKDGETLVSGKPLWLMLSQNMGVHAGDNIELDGDGTYEVEIAVSPFSVRRTGAFRDRFGELGTASFTMDFAQSTLEAVRFERLQDRQGERGALDPMEMDMIPVGQAPATEDLPGTVLGEAKSGDAIFVATRLESPPAGFVESDDEGADSATGTDSDAGTATATGTAAETGTATDSAGGDSATGTGSYLAVSMRTPYNRYPIPETSVSATVDRGGETVFEGGLVQAFDPDLGCHYGAVADVRSGDELTLSVGAPPQISRHEGYETAFVDFSETTITAGE